MADKREWGAQVPSAKGSEEIEIIEFCLGEEYYGIDVMEVREIIKASMGIVPVSGAHPSISGVINLRGKIIPVINLSRHFNIRAEYDLKKSRIIVSAFNHAQVGFWVHRVTRIYRILQSEIEPPSNLVQSQGEYVLGVTKIDGRILFLLNFGRIASDIKPSSDRHQEKSQPILIPRADFDRASKTILIAEDSDFIRKLLARYAREAGYQVLTVSDGLEAWTVLEDLTRDPGFKDIAGHYHLLLTDIEMPRMDGFHLIRKIRENSQLKRLPCVVFAPSLSEELSKQCLTAGADAQIAKDEMDQLISVIDARVIR